MRLGHLLDQILELFQHHQLFIPFDQFLPKKVRDRFAWVKRQSVIDKATYCHDTTSLAPFVSANEDLMKLKQEVASLLEVPEEGNINEVADDAREKLANL
ncbi:hypothetical protein Tco_1080693 [Tanacetum coccineum]|uniref:Uncharacterized protein n=1 Tax=Tanacetum coccineum TaxID=301880 RepID=A0ABQ5HVH8_9ASTR